MEPIQTSRSLSLSSSAQTDSQTGLFKRKFQNFVNISILLILSRVVGYIILKQLFVLMLIYILLLAQAPPISFVFLHSKNVRTK